jgi:shikimate dehydrogenase
VTIDGHTKIIGIFGWPLTYTKSPAFQNAGLNEMGLNAVYLPFPVTEGDFPSLWRTLSKLPNFLGANVTNPHKRAAFRLADRLSPEAKAIGAVNTLFRRGRSWVGHNTDAAGFLAALPQSPKGRRAIVFGSGGTARALAYALLKSGASRVDIACRRPSQGRALLKSLKANPRTSTVRALGKEGLASLLAGVEFSINTVPSPAFAQSLSRALKSAKGLRVSFDANYSRSPYGLAMLLAQGCLSLECWTGKKAPQRIMRSALRRAP